MTMNHNVLKSKKLDNVLYDIRGPVLEEAERLEAAGIPIVKLNIGNPAPFGFKPKQNFFDAIISNLDAASGYCDSQGIFEARQAIITDKQQQGIKDLEPSDIFIGNGVSELIVMAMQALLNNGDEILVPSPDYPLWTAAITLSGGKAVHYTCEEQNNWEPNVQDIQSKISHRTKGIVIINPNNPTGAVYNEDTLDSIAKIAHQHGLAVFSDEIYSKILYENSTHIPMAKVVEAVSDRILCLTFDGLSKNFLAPGFRCGWLSLNGNKKNYRDYIAGLQMLANMRLCANVTAMLGIKAALADGNSIEEFTSQNGRLEVQKQTAYSLFNSIDGLSCSKPRGAFYLFPKIDMKKININNDEKFVLDFLKSKRILLVHGTAFNYPKPDHFRVVFLPNVEMLKKASTALEDFLKSY